MSKDKEVKTWCDWRIPGTPCQSGLPRIRYYPPEYHEIKGVDGALWLRVELEQADTHAGVKPI